MILLISQLFFRRIKARTSPCLFQVVLVKFIYKLSENKYSFTVLYYFVGEETVVSAFNLNDIGSVK